jgi:Rha family phage regulatory protein
MFSLVNFHETFYAISDGKQWTTSLNIAEVFGKEHKNVIRDIENLECSQAFRKLNFEPSNYVTSQGKEMPMYDITRDGFSFLVMGFI